MTLREIIDAAVKSAIADMVAGETNGSTAGELASKAAIETAGEQPSTPRKTRKRGRGRAKVRYVRATKPGRQKDAKAVANDLPAGNVRLTWLAIVAAKQPISALELEKKTELGKKAVESAVWALRNAGLVKSQAVAAE